MFPVELQRVSTSLCHLCAVLGYSPLSQCSTRRNDGREGDVLRRGNCAEAEGALRHVSGPWALVCGSGRVGAGRDGPYRCYDAERWIRSVDGGFSACAHGNIDSFMIAIQRYAHTHGHSSAVLNVLGVPLNPAAFLKITRDSNRHAATSAVTAPSSPTATA